MSSGDARECPHCGRWALKDDACAYVFACGLDARGVFHVGSGCGRPFCWTCGLAYCGLRHDPDTGAMLPGARDSHDAACCPADGRHCEGGHSSHRAATGR